MTIQRRRAFLMITCTVLFAAIPHSSTFAQKAPTADKALARVLQQTITTSQIEPDDALKKQAKAQLKGKYNEWLTQVRTVRLASLVWEPLQQQFVKEKGIVVAPSEVTTFFDYAKKAREMQKTQYQEALKRINADMQAGKLSAQEKTQAEAMKKQVVATLDALGKPLPEPTQQEKDFAQRTVQVWKFDQLLYKQYGGTVVMKQANPFEPIGAYKKFLEDKEKAKSFEILDASYKKSFWTVFEAPKQAMVIPPAKVDYSKPWWILMVEQGQQQMKNAK
jgi:hypothetical protein